MPDHLITLVGHLGHGAYLVIFVGATLEASAFLGLFIPGETLVLLGGFLASRGILDVGDLAMLVAVGAVLGDSVGYELGRRLGRPWLARHGRRFGVTKRRLERVDAYMDRHGGNSIFFGRFIGFARALIPFLAGCARLSYPRFLAFNVAGGIAWAVIVVWLGYYLGAGWTVVERWAGQASAVVGGVGLVLGLLLVLRAWLVRHEAGLKRLVAGVATRPRVLALRRRSLPVRRFLRARLSPAGYLGLHLTTGVAVLVAAVWLFGGIAQDVLAGDPLTRVDLRVESWWVVHRAPWLTRVMEALTGLASAPAVAGIGLVLALLLVRRRSWYRLLALVLALPGGVLLNGLLKELFRRPRPTPAPPFTPESGYGFPSGHASAAVLVYGMLAFVASAWIREWSHRVTMLMLVALLVLLIGLSRLYLGVHYLSDVLGAMTLSIAWLALCLTAVETYRRYREEEASGT